MAAQLFIFGSRWSEKRFFEPADCLVRAAPKEKKMKRNLSLWLGLLTFALLPALAQTPTGKIHGHVINPSGAPEKEGTVTVFGVDRAASGPGLNASMASKGIFPIDANGYFSGDVAPGTYKLIFRLPGMPNDKEVDHVDNVKIISGQDTLQDIDMTRKEYIDALPAETRKQLEELKKHNAEAMKTNAMIKNINADINTVNQDNKDADNAHAAAVLALGASASRSDIAAKEAEIKAAKYAEIETLMLRDTAAKPDAGVLWVLLGQAQISIANVKSDAGKYAEAESNLKKSIDLDSAAKKPSISDLGIAYSGLGEIYARTGRVPEADAAYDSAAKANPPGAATYLKNEAVIFSQVGNSDASVAAADKAILADPTQPMPYYLKGQGLIQKATIDSATGKMILPPGCAEAYQKYLELARPPYDIYVGDVKGILAEATQTHSSTYGEKSKKKK